MKKYILNILFFVGSLGLTSCESFLDVNQYFNDLNQLDSVFNNRNTTEQWLWQVYSRLNGSKEICNKMDCGFNFASDDLFYGDRTASAPCSIYQNGEYGPSRMMQEDRWGSLYCGIREASIFIYNVDRCTQLSKIQIEDYKAQARFLRAYFYWLLIKQWGPVPILPEEGMDPNLSYQDLATSRNSYDECVDYITNEFAEAAIHLSKDRSTSQLGMISKGAALAARAKVLLYAASPLYNGNKDLFSLKDDQGNQLINQVYDESKWARAAAAAKEVIDLNYYALYTVPASSTTVLPPAELLDKEFPLGCGGIDPYKSYRQLFNGTAKANHESNPELIFFRQNDGGDDINSMVRHSYPRFNGFDGWNTNSVTLKQVDAYYMFDGKDKEEARGKGEYPYYEDGYITGDDQDANYKFVRRTNNRIEQICRRFGHREPRFYASIAYCGTKWESLSASETSGTNIRNDEHAYAYYYRSERNGKRQSEPEFHPRTGFGLFKYYNPDDTWQSNGVSYTTYKVEPDIRYADVLLWYAEALNELTKEYTFDTYDKKGKITVKRDVNEMSSAFSQVRFRAGLPDANNYNDPDEFRVTLKRERQIELFAETSRYFDLRRWKDAPEEESQPIMGMNVNAGNSQQDEFYKVVPSDMPKVWLDRMYLWPIPKNETDRNTKLTQNPGWQ